MKRSVFKYMKKDTSVKIFQQDGGPKHTAVNVQDYLTENLGAHGWTHPPPAPCKQATKKGKLCKDNKIRYYAVDATMCTCKVPCDYVHAAKSPDVAIMENLWTWMVTESKKHPVPQSAGCFFE